MAEVVVFKQ